ncbi:MAG: hypothetical protein WC809_18750 [Sinimarinibacterium sp.]|jgi:hypothetical protein
MAKTIGDLYERLFDTLDQVKDKTAPMEIDRAKAIATVAQTIINAAKVEVDFIRARGDGKGGTGFVPEAPQLPGTPDQPRLVKGSAQSGSR